MDDVSISTIVSASGHWGINYKAAGAFQLNTEAAMTLKTKMKLNGNVGFMEMVDDSGQTEIALQLPSGAMDTLRHAKPGPIPSYMAGFQITKLNGQALVIHDLDYLKNKLSCEATVSKKAKDGFGSFWADLGTGLADLIVKAVLPQFKD